jgi:hypothetical protein
MVRRWLTWLRSSIGSRLYYFVQELFRIEYELDFERCSGTCEECYEELTPDRFFTCSAHSGVYAGTFRLTAYGAKITRNTLRARRKADDLAMEADIEALE